MKVQAMARNPTRWGGSLRAATFLFALAVAPAAGGNVDTVDDFIALADQAAAEVDRLLVVLDDHPPGDGHGDAAPGIVGGDLAIKRTELGDSSQSSSSSSSSSGGAGGTRLLDSDTTVTDLGCWSEGYPSALKPVGTVQTGWKTASPITCACLCRTAHGAKWDGLVGIGYQHKWSACTCGVHGYQSFTYKARGRKEPECCPAYDGELGIVGAPRKRRISCPCKYQCASYRSVTGGKTASYKSCRSKCSESENPVDVKDSALKAALHGAGSNNYWTQRVFSVTLGAHCAPETCPSPLPGQSSTPEGNRPASWSKFQICPVPSGFAEDNQVCTLKSGTPPHPTTVRVGGRTPTKSGVVDTFVAGNVEMGGTKGATCGVPLLLEVAGKGRSLSMTLATKLDADMVWTDDDDVLWPVPKTFTRAESAMQIQHSLDFICKHPRLVRMESLTCWRELDAKETAGGDDCSPEIPRGSPLQKAPDWANDPHGTLKRDALVANLARDIIPSIEHGCPDLQALGAQLHPLLSGRIARGADIPGEQPPVAFVIPYRARPIELRKWLRWMIPTLLRKGAPRFRIFVAELAPGMLWNKARLNNAAVVELRKLKPKFGCVIFADVDLVLQVSAADLAKGACQLTCNADMPVHYATKLLGYNKPYSAGIVPGVFCAPGSECTGPPAYHGGQSSGGVVGLTMSQFETVNGWPNSVWGWGKEDGLFDARIKGKYGHMTSPIEWAAMLGNAHCVWVHMQDAETAVKGASGVDDSAVESTFDVTRLYESGYRQVGPLYTLLKTTDHELYTTFLFSLHDAGNGGEDAPVPPPEDKGTRETDAESNSEEEW